MTLDNTTRHIYSVSELNRTVRQILDIELPAIWLEGEISNLARPASGHWYFSLKDQNAQIRCAMFKRGNARVAFAPENGDKVLIRGKISLYEARGEYQLIVEQMEEAGTGALQRAYEELRDKLSKEGLFAAEHKQDLPQLPHCIGVITSGSGAALHDITQVLERRLPMLEIKVYPVLVQGDLAPSEITHAIKQADHEGLCDVLIVGRGGGSLEDLWAFNDERVARAAYKCKTPIISAVGHEVDFTILDFVADLRAPTPSAAAELATPITSDELLSRLISIHQHMTRLFTTRIKHESNVLSHLDKRLQLAHPGQWVNQQQQKLDNFTQRLQNLLKRSQSERTQKIQRLKERLQRQQPAHKIIENKKEFEHFRSRLLETMKHQLNRRKQNFSRINGIMHAFSPLKTLERGYAVVQVEDDKLGKTVISSVSQLEKGQSVVTDLQDGKFESIVKKIIKEK